MYWKLQKTIAMTIIGLSAAGLFGLLDKAGFALADKFLQSPFTNAQVLGLGLVYVIFSLNRMLSN